MSNTESRFAELLHDRDSAKFVFNSIAVRQYAMRIMLVDNPASRFMMLYKYSEPTYSGALCSQCGHCKGAIAFADAVDTCVLSFWGFLVFCGRVEASTTAFIFLHLCHIPRAILAYFVLRDLPRPHQFARPASKGRQAVEDRIDDTLDEVRYIHSIFP